MGVILLYTTYGCEGPQGPRGPAGQVGEAGPSGERGAPGELGERGPEGERGPSGADAPEQSSEVALEPDGVVGVVRDPSGALVTAGEVVLVPAPAVAELAKEGIDLSLAPDAVRELDNDEPLEDLLDRHPEYARAVVQSDGSYRFQQVAQGRYFVVFSPAADDAAHLPGGSACRSAVDAQSLVGTRLPLRVSGRPPEHARYVGSTSCFGCHGRQRSTRTAHRVGLQLPAARGPYQDVAPWGAELDAALRAFAPGKTLYFYDCDAARPGDAKCRVSEADPSLANPPAASVFELRLARDEAVSADAVGHFTATFTNRAGSGTASFPIALSYGGVLGRQQYVTRRSNADASYTYFVLPLQYNAQGSTERPSSDDWPYRDYRADHWYDFVNNTLRMPEPARSFDTECAGCHLTGFQLAGDDSKGYRASAVSDPNGDFDYDGDGRAEEINIGCESCHGPGSEHIEARERGRAIVSPSLLTPERELMLCGRCHSRPQAAHEAHSQAPLSAAGLMPGPGLRRSELAAFTSRMDAASEQLWPSGDSKANHQQYSDFLRSSMARNGSVLMTCSSCHDAHGSDQHAHELRSAPNDNAACTGCHAEQRYSQVRDHVKQATNEAHDNVDGALLTCTSCHMVKTIAAGARHPELLDFLPRSSPQLQYEHGDLASHRFAVTRRAQAPLQPVAASLSCAFCHSMFLDNP